jgi:hypothetical protein
MSFSFSLSSPHTIYTTTCCLLISTRISLGRARGGLACCSHHKSTNPRRGCRSRQAYAESTAPTTQEGTVNTVGASRTQLFGLLIHLEAAPCEITKDIRPLERKLHEVRPHPVPYDFEDPLFSGNKYGRVVVASKNDSPTTESVSPSMEFIRTQTLEWVYHRLRQMLRGTGRAMSKKSWTPRCTDITFCMALLSGAREKCV